LKRKIQMASKISENLSSNTFFHFTKSIENLTSILYKNFEPRYCLEKTEYFSNSNINNIEMAYPMVCFCDIPLSKIKKHIGFYGNYGIGLKKKWGYRKNLSPVIYTRKNARTSKNLEQMINWSANLISKERNKDQDELKSIVSDFIMFTKPYFGEIYRKGKIKKKRFYDEREWRWIPKIIRKDTRMHLTKEEYFNEYLKNKENKIVAEHYTLSFNPDDISYLIINDESEIDDLIGSIERIKSRFDVKTIKRLTSRIITKEQILYDF